MNACINFQCQYCQTYQSNFQCKNLGYVYKNIVIFCRQNGLKYIMTLANMNNTIAAACKILNEESSGKY